MFLLLTLLLCKELGLNCCVPLDQWVRRGEIIKKKFEKTEIGTGFGSKSFYVFGIGSETYCMEPEPDPDPDPSFPKTERIRTDGSKRNPTRY